MFGIVNILKNISKSLAFSSSTQDAVECSIDKGVVGIVNDNDGTIGILETQISHSPFTDG